MMFICVKLLHFEIVIVTSNSVYVLIIENKTDYLGLTYLYLQERDSDISLYNLISLSCQLAQGIHFIFEVFSF